MSVSTQLYILMNVMSTWHIPGRVATSGSLQFAEELSGEQTCRVDCRSHGMVGKLAGWSDMRVHVHGSLESCSHCPCSRQGFLETEN